MRILITAQEDNIQGGYGWTVDRINGRRYFDYDNEFFTAQSEPGLTLAHDIIEHGCRSVEDPNVNELTALGAILYNREQDFYNGFGTNTFASEIYEQLRILVDRYQDELYLVDDLTSHNEYVNDYYDNFREEIEGLLLDEVIDMESELEEDLENCYWDRIHDIAIAALSRGYNHMVSLERRYNCDTEYRFLELQSEINDILGDLDAEECYNVGTRVYINFTYEYGVESHTVYNRPTEW